MVHGGLSNQGLGKKTRSPLTLQALGLFAIGLLPAFHIDKDVYKLYKAHSVLHPQPCLLQCLLLCSRKSSSHRGFVLCPSVRYHPFYDSFGLIPLNLVVATTLFVYDSLLLLSEEVSTTSTILVHYGLLVLSGPRKYVQVS